MYVWIREYVFSLFPSRFSFACTLNFLWGVMGASFAVSELGQFLKVATKSFMMTLCSLIKLPPFLCADLKSC